MGESGVRANTRQLSVTELARRANQQLPDCGTGFVRFETVRQFIVLRGPTARAPQALLEAGAAIFEVRALGEEFGCPVDVVVLPRARNPKAWAVLTVHPRRTRSRLVTAAGPGRPVPVGSSNPERPPRVRELVHACVRGAAGEGVGVRVAPMPLAHHVGLVLRARSGGTAGWLAVGQAWAGIERLADVCGWTAHLGKTGSAGPQAEVWLEGR